MWGPQGWNQWALQQPAMFNDIPHEQIDWAELAKQWIQMKQTHPPSEMVQPAPPPLPPPLPPQVPAIPVSLPPPPGHSPIPIEEFSEKKVSPPPPLLKTPASASAMPEPFLSERPFPNEPGLKFKKDTYPTSGLVFDKYQTRENFTRPKKSAYLPKASDNNFWGKPHWEENTSNDVDERLWNPPSVDPSVPMLGKETFDYGHVRDNPPLAMQSIDYNHMSEFSYNSVYPPPVPVPESHYDQYWSQINVAPSISPMFLKKERTSNLHVEEDTNQIDAAKRKTLPAWIRDGLEKMEQERLKRLEKEREAKESAEKAAKSAALKKESKEEPSLIPSKSKFESDSEEGELEEEVVQKQSPPVEKRQPSPVEDLRTEEEKKQDLVLKVRRTLTEVLLSVTSSEMIAIAQDMLKKAISKESTTSTPARQLAPSTSLSSVASGLRGLASYGTESEASEAEEDEEDEEDDSEEELYRKIKEKKRLFAVKERKIIADLEEKELEEKLSAERLINEIKSNKERTNTETKAEISNNVNLTDRIPANTLSPEKETLTIEMPTKSEDLKENNSKERPPEVPEKKKPKAATKDESVSSDSSSSSSDSESESSDKHKKKISKETKKSKPESKKDSKKDKKSSKKDSHRKRSRSRDSESSGKHRRQRSRERKSKKKKSKRSDSSSSSSDSSHKKGRRSSKYESSRNHKESRNKSHDDRKRKRSPSPSRSHRKSDSHSSRSYKHEEEKHRRHKEEKRQREHRRSSSPSRHRTSSSSKVPRKYRSSRSLSSESESSGKKSKKSRNR